MQTAQLYYFVCLCNPDIEAAKLKSICAVTVKGKKNGDLPT